MVSFTLLPLYPGETASGTRCIGVSIGPRSVLDDVEKRNISRRFHESNLESSVIKPVA
jgi:hypothetical protein